MRKKKLTWKQFDECICSLAKSIPIDKFQNIYGVPRGGLIVAIALCHKTGLPFVTHPGTKQETLIVDDICDRGYTLDKLRKYRCATIYYRKNDLFEPDYWIIDAEDKFIVFPWETKASAKMDYLEE